MLLKASSVLHFKPNSLQNGPKIPDGRSWSSLWRFVHGQEIWPANEPLWTVVGTAIPWPFPWRGHDDVDGTAHKNAGFKTALPPPREPIRCNKKLIWLDVYSCRAEVGPDLGGSGTGWSMERPKSAWLMAGPGCGANKAIRHTRFVIIHSLVVSVWAER